MGLFKPLSTCDVYLHARKMTSFPLTRLHQIITPAFLVRRWPGVVFLFVLCAADPTQLIGQSEKSPIFPEQRHQELMEEIVFEPDEEEEEPEKEVADFDWDFNWDFDLSNTATLIIFLLLVAILGFLIFRILGDVDMRKRTRSEAEEEEAFVNLDEIEEEKMVAQGVSLSLLDRAENAGQFDVAVRLLYIKLLKELQDAGLIKYRRDYSNRDYQKQLSGTEFLTDFREVTVDYERYWYGKYTIEKLGYRLVQRKFNILSGRIPAPSTKAEPYA